MSSFGDFMLIASATDLGLVIRDRRKALGLDQRTLAQRVGVSRQWIVEIESGKPRAEVGLVLRTLRALDVEIDVKVGARPKASKRDAADLVDLDALIDKARGKRR
jgi:HTH-type transcriptional regulator / antitoxin HipB